MFSSTIARVYARYRPRGRSGIPAGRRIEWPSGAGRPTWLSALRCRPDRAQLAALLADYGLIPPGIVDVILWQLDPEILATDVARYSA